MPGPLTTEDRLDIYELLARFCWALDTANEQGFGKVFAEDGILDMPRGRRFTGREEIRGYLRSYLKSLAPDFFSRQHQTTQILIDGDGEHAIARSSVLGMHEAVGDARPWLMMIGFYEDELVKVEGRWFIQRRVLKTWNREAAATPELDRLLQPF